jgi:hypothetical protein
MEVFMRLFILTVILVLFSSCSKQARSDTSAVITNALSGAIVTALTCSNSDVVKADVKSVVDGWFNLKSSEEKGIVQDLCKMVIAEVVPGLIGSQIPESWGCKLTTLDNASTLLANIACSSIKI